MIGPIPHQCLLTAKREPGIFKCGVRQEKIAPLQLWNISRCLCLVSCLMMVVTFGLETHHENIFSGKPWQWIIIVHHNELSEMLTNTHLLETATTIAPPYEQSYSCSLLWPIKSLQSDCVWETREDGADPGPRTTAWLGAFQADFACIHLMSAFPLELLSSKLTVKKCCRDKACGYQQG